MVIKGGYLNIFTHQVLSNKTYPDEHSICSNKIWHMIDFNVRVQVERRVFLIRPLRLELEKRFDP